MHCSTFVKWCFLWWCYIFVKVVTLHWQQTLLEQVLLDQLLQQVHSTYYFCSLPVCKYFDICLIVLSLFIHEVLVSDEKIKFIYFLKRSEIRLDTTTATYMLTAFCLFVNTITSKWLNVGWWKLAVRCNVQKSRPSSNLRSKVKVNRDNKRSRVALFFRNRYSGCKLSSTSSMPLGK